MVDPATFWIGAHVFALLLLFLFRQFPPLGGVAVVVLILWSLIIKPPTYDLVHYLDFLSAPEGRSDFEIGFRLFAQATAAIFGGNPIASYALLSFGSVVALWKLHRGVAGGERGRACSVLGVLAAMTLCIFFFLGTQNVLRQYLSLIFLALSTVYFVRSERALSVIAFVLATSFHQSAILFGALIALSLTVRKCGAQTAVLLTVSFSMLFFAALGLVQPTNPYFYEDFSWSEERSSAAIKLAAYSFVVGATHLLLVNSPLNRQGMYREILFLRWICVAFAAPAVWYGYDDLFSRLVFPLFLLDFLILAAVLSKMSIRLERASAAILIAGYAVAPNVLNVYRGLS